MCILLFLLITFQNENQFCATTLIVGLSAGRGSETAGPSVIIVCPYPQHIASSVKPTACFPFHLQYCLSSPVTVLTSGPTDPHTR
ncbi:hypothetical protein EDB84DRAFT_689585 [Lactarius hengduanensis]|nr:hypothetical protein EDB84DRAFT_689585 [Lactarius hengduanensis]